MLLFLSSLYFPSFRNDANVGSNVAFLGVVKFAYCILYIGPLDHRVGKDIDLNLFDGPVDPQDPGSIL
jgi:hypothetical protein